MSKQTVFLVGATGETGASILDALLEDGSFDMTCFIRTASAGKPAVQDLKDRGIKVVTGDLSGPTENTVGLLQGIDTVISSIFAPNVFEQDPLIDAAVKAGVKRFVPCNWATPAARGGIMQIRDLKEQCHDRILRQRLGYTIIDVGYWYEMSLPRVPSGKTDYAIVLPINEVYAGGTAPNMLMAKKDVGRFTVRIIKDKRTLNKRVYGYGALLSQNEINDIVAEKSGEKLDLVAKSAEDVQASLNAAEKKTAEDPSNVPNMYLLAYAQYCNTKYVRADNTPENAEYLGYLNGRELYPDFEWMGFADFVDNLIAGEVKRPYPHLTL
ncbi:hypothetical protein RBB50_002657 [Rhinocladiella similis]